MLIKFSKSINQVNKNMVINLKTKIYNTKNKRNSVVYNSYTNLEQELVQMVLLFGSWIHQKLTMNGKSLQGLEEASEDGLPQRRNHSHQLCM